MISRWWLTGLAALAMLLALVVWGIPWLTQDRVVVASTPTPPPFATISPVVLDPGSEACVSAVALSPDTRVAIVLSDQFDGQDGTPLRVTAQGADGYEGVGEIAAGYGGLSSLPAVLEPTPPRDEIGEVCIENTGRRDAQLQGTTEGRIQNRAITTVDGEIIPEKLSLLLTEGESRSIADRPGQILDRIAAFKPPIVGTWSLALLFLLLLVGVPAGVLYSIKRGIADDR